MAICMSVEMYEPNYMEITRAQQGLWKTTEVVSQIYSCYAYEAVDLNKGIRIDHIAHYV